MPQAARPSPSCWLALEVHAARPERPVDLRAVSRGGQACRRPVPAQQHAHRPADPSAGVPADAHRHLPVHPAVAGRLDALRPGHREREPARLHHASARRVNNGGAGELRQRVPARDLPGHAASAIARHRPIADGQRQQHRQSRAQSPTPSGMQLDFIQSLNRDAPGTRPHNPASKG